MATLVNGRAAGRLEDSGMSPDWEITLIPPFPICLFLMPFPYLPDTLYTTDAISRCMLSMISYTGLCRYISVCTFPFRSPFPLLHDHWHMPIHYIGLKSSLPVPGHCIYLILPHRCPQSDGCDSVSHPVPPLTQHNALNIHTVSLTLDAIWRDVGWLYGPFSLEEKLIKQWGRSLVSGLPLWLPARSFDLLEPSRIAFPSRFWSLDDTWIIEGI